MSMNRVLGISAAVLAAFFGFGVAVRYHQKPGVHMVASWANSPETIADAKKLSEDIVLGRVTRIRRAEDLAIRAEGEPGDVDRVPVECVTVQTERAYKGARKETIEVFHTGLSKGNTGADRGDPPGPPPPKPPGGVDRPPGGVHPDPNEVRSIILDDDPLYKSGDRVVLFLTKGPRIRVGNSDVDSMAVVAPEGRFTIDANGRVKPATGRHESGRFDNRPLEDLEREIMRP